MDISRRHRTIVGVGCLVLIPAIVPFLGITTTYGKAQLSQAGPLADLVCDTDPATGRLRCDTPTASEIRSSTRRDDWWVLGYGLLGAVALACLTSLRGRHRILGIPAVALLAAGQVADLVENAKLRNSIAALTRMGPFADHGSAVAAVGGNPAATVLFGRLKTGFLATALLLLVVSLVRPRVSR